MNKRLASESIWSNGQLIIPMYDVSHIERIQGVHYPNAPGNHSPVNRQGIRVITNKSRFNFRYKYYENAPVLWGSEADQFVKDWCQFRSEIDPVQSSKPEKKE